MEKKENKKTEQAKDNSKELAFYLTKAFFKFMTKNPDATVGDGLLGMSLFTATFLAKVDKESKSKGKDPFGDYLELLTHNFLLGKEFADAGIIFDKSQTISKEE